MFLHYYQWHQCINHTEILDVYSIFKRLDKIDVFLQMLLLIYKDKPGLWNWSCLLFLDYILNIPRVDEYSIRISKLSCGIIYRLNSRVWRQKFTYSASIPIQVTFLPENKISILFKVQKEDLSYFSDLNINDLPNCASISVGTLFD